MNRKVRIQIIQPLGKILPLSELADIRIASGNIPLQLPAYPNEISRLPVGPQQVFGRGKQKENSFVHTRNDSLCEMSQHAPSLTQVTILVPNPSQDETISILMLFNNKHESLHIQGTKKNKFLEVLSTNTLACTVGEETLQNTVHLLLRRNQKESLGLKLILLRKHKAVAQN